VKSTRVRSHADVSWSASSGNLLLQISIKSD
jgi:hypothetical protein